MSKEAFKSMGDLPNHSRWDGKTKYFTKECLSCDGYLNLSDGEVCVKGVAWKQLTREKIRNTCQLKKDINNEREAAQAQKHPVIIFTPSLIHFYDGTMEALTAIGFSTRLVRKEDVEGKSGFSLEFE